MKKLMIITSILFFPFALLAQESVVEINEGETTTVITITNDYIQVHDVDNETGETTDRGSYGKGNDSTPDSGYEPVIDVIRNPSE